MNKILNQIDIKPSWVSKINHDTREKTIGLIIQSIKDDGMLGFEEAHDPAIHRFVDGLQEKLEDGGCWLLQAETETELAYSVVMERSTNPTAGHIAEIKKAIIHPKHRGGGLVIQGLSAILRKAQAEGIERLVIDVREGTRAEKLWRSLGFVEYGRLPDYSRFGGGSYAGIYMTATVIDLDRSFREQSSESAR